MGSKKSGGKILCSEKSPPIAGFELPDIEDLSVFRHGVTKAEQSTDPVQVRAGGANVVGHDLHVDEISHSYRVKLSRDPFCHQRQRPPFGEYPHVTTKLPDIPLEHIVRLVERSIFYPGLGGRCEAFGNVGNLTRLTISLAR